MTVNNSGGMVNPKLTDDIKGTNVNKVGGEAKQENVKAKNNENKSNSIKDGMEGMLKEGGALKSLDFEKGMGLIFEPEPAQVAKFVESIRNSEGGDRDQQLLNFQNKLDKMGNRELKMVRDHLVKEMANPKNNDDELLGALLNAVNKEMDSRDNNIKPMPKPFPFPEPGPLPKPFPGPFPDPMPKPLPPWGGGEGGCFPTPGKKMPWDEKLPDDLLDKLKNKKMPELVDKVQVMPLDRKSTRLNSSH